MSVRTREIMAETLLGTSQAALAEQLSVVVPGIKFSRATISHWARGDNDPRYCDVLAVFMGSAPESAIHTFAGKVLNVLRPDLWDVNGEAIQPETRPE